MILEHFHVSNPADQPLLSLKLISTFTSSKAFETPRKWSTPTPPAARPSRAPSVSVPLRPSALVARRVLSTAPATRLPPRMPSPALAAHAVSLHISSYQLTLRRLIRLLGSRPAGQCTCERSVSENKAVEGDTCPCGSRPSGESSFHSPLKEKRNIRLETVF